MSGVRVSCAAHGLVCVLFISLDLGGSSVSVSRFAAISLFVLSLSVACAKNHAYDYRYRVVQNPGGEEFYDDSDFVKKYERYEKIRDRSERTYHQHENRHGISVSSRVIEDDIDDEGDVKHAVPGVLDHSNSMVNADGIDIASLKGAKYVDDKADAQSKNGKSNAKSTQTSTKTKNLTPKSTTKEHAAKVNPVIPSKKAVADVEQGKAVTPDVVHKGGHIIAPGNNMPLPVEKDQVTAQKSNETALPSPSEKVSNGGSLSSAVRVQPDFDEESDFPIPDEGDF